jgi:GntR family transcriptional regulator, transcriptional repressor for pyruvate dehydrogenase complex
MVRGTDNVAFGVAWEPYREIRQYEYVLEKIKGLMASGVLRPGDRLPSERELSGRLGVGRASIKEAFRILEILGLIKVKHGDGSYINKVQYQFFESFGNAASLFGELTAETMDGFLEFRSTWEIKCAVLAAKNATEEDIKMMDIEIRRMEKSARNETEFKAADINFHNFMCIASKDKSIMLVVQGLRNILITFFNNVYPLVCSDEKLSQEAYAAHDNILQAIKHHDEEAAVQAMEAHLLVARHNLMRSCNMLQ